MLFGKCVIYSKYFLIYRIFMFLKVIFDVFEVFWFFGCVNYEFFIGVIVRGIILK